MCVVAAAAVASPSLHVCHIRFAEGFPALARRESAAYYNLLLGVPSFHQRNEVPPGLPASAYEEELKSLTKAKSFGRVLSLLIVHDVVANCSWVQIIVPSIRSVDRISAAPLGPGWGAIEHRAPIGCCSQSKLYP
jgi:hypothetical protein